MTGKYDKLILSGRAGVFAAPRLIGPLRTAAKRAGITWLDLDLAGVCTTTSTDIGILYTVKFDNPNP